MLLCVVQHTHKTEITIRLTAWKDKLIFKLKFNQMDTKKINDTDVDCHADIIAVLKKLDIENAKQVLKEAGYYVDNLWQTCDVTMNYECTEEQAQDVLDKSLTNDYVQEQIFSTIKEYAEYINLKHKD